MSVSVGDRLRQLAEAATPGPWKTGKTWSTIQGLRMQAVHDAFGQELGGHLWCHPADAHLIALAPDLAVLCADLADALAAYESFYDDDCGESGCEDCEPGRRLRALLARVAGLAQEQT